MSQRGIAQVLVLLGILFFSIIGIGTLYFARFNDKSIQVSNSPSPNSTSQPKTIISPSPKPSSVKPTSQPTSNPTSTPTTSSYSPPADAKIHLAGDASISISNIKIKAVIIQPKDVSPPASVNWQALANDWYKEVIAFWQRELNNRSTISFETHPQIISGDLDMGQYNFNNVYTEVYQKINPQRNSNEFLVLFIYVLNDDQHYYSALASGTHTGNLGIVVAPMDNKFALLKFYSDEPNVHGRGQPAEEAHEIGHALGLQHTSDNPDIRAKYAQGSFWKSPCDLMLGQGYNQNPNFSDIATLLDTHCILPEQKQLFFK